MRAVNLLPSEKLRAGDARPTGSGPLTTGRVLVVGGSLAAIVTGVVGFTFVGARGDVATKRQALHTVQQQVAEARARAAAHVQKRHASAPQSLPADTQAQLATFNMAAATRVAWDQLLSDVSRVLPAGTWLSSLTLQSVSSTPAPAGTTPGTNTPVTTPGAAPTGFTASGFALSQPAVARLMQRLALVPMLSDITLQRSERANVGADRAFQFTLSASVRIAGAS